MVITKLSIEIHGLKKRNGNPSHGDSKGLQMTYDRQEVWIALFFPTKGEKEIQK